MTHYRLGRNKAKRDGSYQGRFFTLNEGHQIA